MAGHRQDDQFLVQRQRIEPLSHDLDAARALAQIVAVQHARTVEVLVEALVVGDVVLVR